METSVKKPVVFDFLHLQSYLHAYYVYRKSTQRRFSYDTWLEEMQLDVNRSFLRLIVLGKKKASPDFIRAFCQQSFSYPQEVEYFQYLVKHSEARTLQEKQVFAQKMTEILRNYSPQEIYAPMPALVCGALPMRLLTLMGFSDLICTTENLAKLLGQSKAIIESGIRHLLEMELIQSGERDGEQIWTAIHTKIRVRENKGSVDLMRFHEQSLLDAIKAFHQPKQTRKYKSLLLPMSEQDLEEFYKRMDDFSSEQFARYASNSFSDKRLFQVNLNVYPVTEKKPEVGVESLTGIPLDS